MRSIITTLILLSSLFIGCSKECSKEHSKEHSKEYSKEIEPEYKEVALKYEKNMIRRKNIIMYHKITDKLKTTDKLTQEQKEYYERFLELNPKFTEEQKEHHYEAFLEYFNFNSKLTEEQKKYSKERYLESHNYNIKFTEEQKEHYNFNIKLTEEQKEHYNFNIKLTQEQKEYHYKRFLEYFNSEIKEKFCVVGVSPNTMASYLDDIWETAIKVIRKYRPEYEDSISGWLVLNGFSHMSDNLYNAPFIDAEFSDLVTAYTTYLPQSAKEKINYSRRHICESELLTLDLDEPYLWESLSKDVEQMVFAYVRRNILTRKLRDSFSEKQKMYMEQNSILFFKSFDEKQAKIYREFNKYNEYLE